MPKRAHSESSTASTDESDCNADSYVFRPTKHRAHSALSCNLSLFSVNTDLSAELLLTFAVQVSTAEGCVVGACVIPQRYFRNER
ncbi:hypothetical protein BM1_10918 [Bipolaris maydis]|nr:hypothetical protein BM1_10918 [Bipolaris maydis]